MYLAALAGLVPMSRHNRRAAILIPLFILSLADTSRGARLDGQRDDTSQARRGGCRSPDTAAVGRARPLSAIPLVHRVVPGAADRVGSERVVVQRAFRQKHRRLIGPTFSGWISRMALPNVELQPLTNPLLWGWIAVAGCLALWPLRRVHVETTRVRSPGRS